MSYWESKHDALKRRLAKHARHDQKTHGNWASGGGKGGETSVKVSSLTGRTPYHRADGKFTNDPGEAARISAKTVRHNINVGDPDQQTEYDETLSTDPPVGFSPKDAFVDPKTGEINHELEMAIAVSSAGLVNRAQEADPAVTSQLQDLAASVGGELQGLEYRTKDETSTARKIRDRMATRYVEEPGGETRLETLGEATAGVKDSLRYTMTFDDADYTNGVGTTMQNLKDAGWTDYPGEEFESYWGKLDDYDGAHVIMSPPGGGLAVELQFHTNDSFKTKGVVHKLYEEYRGLPIFEEGSPKYERAEEQRRGLWTDMVWEWSKDRSSTAGGPPGWPPAGLTFKNKAHEPPRGYDYGTAWARTSADGKPEAFQPGNYDYFQYIAQESEANGGPGRMRSTLGRAVAVTIDTPASGPTRWANQYGSGYVQGEDERQDP